MFNDNNRLNEYEIWVWGPFAFTRITNIEAPIIQPVERWQIFPWHWNFFRCCSDFFSLHIFRGYLGLSVPFLLLSLSRSLPLPFVLWLSFAIFYLNHSSPWLKSPIYEIEIETEMRWRVKETYAKAVRWKRDFLSIFQALLLLCC